MGKNIVLLSDGTGNSAASAQKTNIWRLYQAVDIGQAPPSGEPRQIAYYDDGVGTGSFKPLAVLGLALGLGVWGNVRDLYTFLCRNYEDGDQLYLFGFSRGAFTVRLLAGLIRRCGLVRWKTEQELLENVGKAHNAYRRDFLYRATKHRPGLLLLRGIVKRPAYVPDEKNTESKIDLAIPDRPQRRPNIAFLGVWDTVDAYGMPIDEWKIGIDRYIWPISVADRYLSSGIDKVCHALSLDDERPTFRPVLWTEEKYKYGEPPGARLEQVWFSGVHANVGGGYPDDGLAGVTLDWMMSKTHLRFLSAQRQEVRDRANREGRYYNSRAGLGGYYRYGPRSVERLSNDTDYGVSIATPKLHQAAIDRIASREVAYAPVSLPSNFTIVGADNPSSVSPPDKAWMEFALDKVWWRRMTYFATVLITAILGLFPVLKWFGVLDKTIGAVPAQVCTWAGEEVCRWPAKIVASGVSFLETVGVKNPTTSLYEFIESVVPGWTKFWLKSFEGYPITVGLLALILAWLFFRKSDEIQASIARRAEYAWVGYKNIASVVPPRPGLSDHIARFMRTYVTNAMHYFVRNIVPIFFGIFTWVLLIAAFVITFPLSLYALYRFLKFLRGSEHEASL